MLAEAMNLVGVALKMLCNDILLSTSVDQAVESVVEPLFEFQRIGYNVRCEEPACYQSNADVSLSAHLGDSRETNSDH